jgi:hypothetical protein
VAVNSCTIFGKWRTCHLQKWHPDAFDSYICIYDVTIFEKVTFMFKGSQILKLNIKNFILVKRTNVFNTQSLKDISE